MNILDEIAEYKRCEVEKRKKSLPLSELRAMAEGAPSRSVGAFERALGKDGLSIIAEVKKASPSKGIISKDFPYVEIAKSYAEAGADAISCLTETKWFLGSDDIFRDIRETVSLPMLRKDFTVDEYQIYEAKAMGADAVLLILSLLDDSKFSEFSHIAKSLGLSVLAEAHDEGEVERAINAGSGIIGVNNRNLKDFTVDFSSSLRLRSLIPDDVIFVAESGVRNPEDGQTLRQIGADAALVGEYLMRSGDVFKAIGGLKDAGGEYGKQI